MSTLDEITTLPDLARVHARERPDAIALSFEGRETTFSELERRAERIAGALIAAGVRRGERIVYLGKNSDRYFGLLLGAARAGVVTTPVGWRLAPPEIAYIAADTEARLMFIGPELVETARAVANDLPHLRVIGLEGPEFEAWLKAHPAAGPIPPVAEDEVALQLYTSGTTGRPKGAMLTHANVLTGWKAAAAADLDWNRWGPEDVSLVAMPVSHIGGTGWGVVSLLNGAKSVIAREFDPFAVLDFIEKDRVSKLFMVPAALQIIVRQERARKVDYSRLKTILYGASPIPLDLLRECMEVFGCGFCQQYGMTETTGSVVYLPPEDHDPAGNRRMRGAGKAFPGVEIAILGPGGEVLPPETVGEVAIRAPGNMAGYWKLPDATAETLIAGGWLRTGDAGLMDKDGYLYIHDRMKDLIITGGENVYPAEVESAVYGHPDVAEVAVIGVPDETWGEAVKAIVVPKPGAAPDPASIIAFARQRIAAFKAPKSVDFVESLPRNASGKILRRQLREPYWSGRERGVN